MCVESVDCGFIRVSCLSYSTNNNSDIDIDNYFVPNCCWLTKALIDFFIQFFFNRFVYSLIGVDSASQVSGARQIIRRYFVITNQNKNKT